MNKVEIIPTCVPADLSALALGARKITEFSDTIHIDVDDGIFTPVTTWPYDKDKNVTDFDLSSVVGLRSEVHLMTEEPRELGVSFARAGAKRIVGHVEGFSNSTEAHGALDSWRLHGAEAGLAILFQTPLEVLGPLIPSCDFVLMMCIATVGTQGIPYDPAAPERIASLHDKYPELLISVDGGVSESNIADLVRAGARRFSVGSAIMKNENPGATYARLKMLAESAIF